MPDDAIPYADEAAAESDLAEWVRAGRENQRAADVIFHAQAFHRAGRRREDCPFGDLHPTARTRWRWMFDVCVKAAREREAKARAKAEAEGRLFPDPTPNRGPNRGQSRASHAR